MPTYPVEVWPSEAVVRELDGTLDLGTGLPYIAKGTGPLSSPSYEVQYNRRAQRLNRILAVWWQGMVVDEGDLTIGVYPIRFTIGGVRLEFAGASGVSIPDFSACVVYLDADAELHVESAYPPNPATFLPLAAVVASGGQLTIVDQRADAAFYVPSLEASIVRERRVVTAHRAAVGSDQADASIFAFLPAEDLVLADVQVYCSGVSAAASVDVKQAGSSLLSSAVTPSAGAVVQPTIVDGAVASGFDVTVHVTTDSAGSVADLTVTLVFKAALSA